MMLLVLVMILILILVPVLVLVLGPMLLLVGMPVLMLMLVVKLMLMPVPVRVRVLVPVLVLVVMLVWVPVLMLMMMLMWVPVLMKKKALPNQQAVPIYNVAIVGDRGVGKTTFLNRLVDADNRSQFTWTFEYPGKPNGPPNTTKVIYPMEFNTNRGPVDFYCWDIAAPGLPGCIYDFDYRGADCAIIMYDVTTLLNYTRVDTWCHWLRKVYGNIPIVLCGNKVDLQNRHIEAEQLASCLLRNNLMYCEISALRNYNFEMPFSFLARKLEWDGWSTVLTRTPALVPPEPEVMIDKQAQRIREQELAEALRQPFLAL